MKGQNTNLNEFKFQFGYILFLREIEGCVCVCVEGGQMRTIVLESIAIFIDLSCRKRDPSSPNQNSPSA